MTNRTNCPDCGSTNITATQDGEILLQTSKIINPVMICQDCGEKFFKDNDSEAHDHYRR